MNTLQFLKERHIDLEPLGLLGGGADVRYFCTPADAEILFRTGVDGVHYCTVKGFGGMVFAVEPMGEAGEMVYPVAETVEDFLRLVMACGSETERSALEKNQLPEDDTVYPRCYTTMTYEVTPPVDRRRMQLRDTHRGDSPIRKGRPNGQVGMMLLLRDDPQRCTAVSSLTFEPRERVEWRVVFHESEHEPITVELLQ